MMIFIQGIKVEIHGRKMRFKKDMVKGKRRGSRGLYISSFATVFLFYLKSFTYYSRYN